MVKISALLYVFLVVVCLILAVVDTYKTKQTWGGLITMVALSFVPILNFIIACVLIDSIVMNSRVMKKKVF